MDDPHYRRAVRIAIIFGMVSLLSIITLTFYVSVEIRRLNDFIVASNTNIEKRIPTVHDGITPIKGVDYTDGNDGHDGRNGQNATSTNTLTVQPLYTNIPVSGPKGDKGDTGDMGVQGEQGPAGRTVFQRINPLTGIQECRYVGDEDWQPLSECQ